MDFALSEHLFRRFSGRTLFSGFSGGADSTALLLLALEAQRRFDLHLVSVHVNHHLRGETSDAEALAAEKFAMERGIGFMKFDLDLGNDAAGLEERAREARLAIWQELTSKVPGSAVLLGHHADDAIENLLMRLGRGSNVSGAIGLRAESRVGGVTFLRPLLRWTRQEIEEFLRARGVTQWAVDASNLTCDHQRSALRTAVIPQLKAFSPAAGRGWLRSLERLEEDARFIEETAEAFYAAGKPYNADFWRNRPPALMARLLRRFVSELFDDDAPLRRAAVERFTAAVEAGDDALIPLDGRRIVRLTRGCLERAGSDAAAPECWRWREEPVIRFGQWEFKADEENFPGTGDPGSRSEWFASAALPEELHLALPVPGQKMIPFGRTEEVKVKKLRVDRTVAASAALPVLTLPDGRVLWYPRVRRSAYFPAQKGEKAVRFSLFRRKNEGKNDFFEENDL